MEAEDSSPEETHRASTGNTTWQQGDAKMIRAIWLHDNASNDPRCRVETIGANPFITRTAAHKNPVLMAALRKIGEGEDREYTRAKIDVLVEIANGLEPKVAKIVKDKIAVLLSSIDQAMVDPSCIGAPFKPPAPSTEVTAMIAGVESVVERARQESFHARLWRWLMKTTTAMHLATTIASREETTAGVISTPGAHLGSSNFHPSTTNAGGGYCCAMNHSNAAACKQERPRYLKHYSITVNVRMDAILSQAGQRSCDTHCNSIELEIVSTHNSHKDIGDIS